jgi:hypothetical protein
LSGATLAKKLGLKSGMTVLLLNSPHSFAPLLAGIPEGIQFASFAKPAVDCVIAFVKGKAEVSMIASAAMPAVRKDGLLWFAYPKKSGKIKTNITRNAGWEPVCQRGFDSVAQVSIDETWIGFRFRETQLIKIRTR